MRTFIYNLTIVTLLILIAITMCGATTGASADEYEPIEENAPLVENESYNGDLWYFYYTLKNYAEELECDMPVIVMMSIARYETGNFTSDAYIYGHNWGGISINEKPVSYESEEAGVIAYINLMQSYYEKGLDTLEKIGERYCPINNDWAKNVKKIMREEEKNIMITYA